MQNASITTLIGRYGGVNRSVYPESCEGNFKWTNDEKGEKKILYQESRGKLLIPFESRKKIKCERMLYVEHFVSSELNKSVCFFGFPSA